MKPTKEEKGSTSNTDILKATVQIASEKNEKGNQNWSLDLSINSKRQQLFNKMIQQFSIEPGQEQEFRNNLEKGMTEQCLLFTTKSKRKGLENLVRQYQALSEQKQFLVPSQQQFLIQLFSEKNGLGEEDLKQILLQCQFCEDNIEKYVECAKKKYQQGMKKQIVQYFQLKKKIRKSQQSDEKFNGKLLQICRKFGVGGDQLNQCLKHIKNTESTEYLQFVNKSKRNEFQQQINKCLGVSNKIEEKNQTLLRIKVGDILLQLRISNGVGELKSKLQSSFDIVQIQQYQMYLDGKQIENLDVIFKQKKTNSLLKFVKRIELKYQFQQKTHNLWVNGLIDSLTLKKRIEADLQQKKIIKRENKKIIVTILNQKLTQIDFTNLNSYLRDSSISKIKVETQIQIILFYESQKIYKMGSLSTLRELKQIIQKEYSLPFQSQSLDYQKDGKRLLFTEAEIDTYLEKFAQGNNYYLSITLTNHHTLQYFGFQSNFQLRYISFSQFLVDSQQQLKTKIKNIDFKNSNSQAEFFYSFAKFLFASLKKRFPLQITIDKVRDLVVKKKLQNIWVSLEGDRPSKMNQAFLLMYLLRNSESLLKIELMNLLKCMAPLPLYIKQFKNIFDNSCKVTLNKEILWVLQNGLTVCSYGLHSKNFLLQKGKSQLLNSIFYTNFCSSLNRHLIIDGVPFVSIKVYQDLFPLNIIDIPHNCDENYAKMIIQKSDVIFVQSWLTQHQTLNFVQGSQFKDKTFCVIRDAKQITRDFLKYINSTDLIKQKMLKIPNLCSKQGKKGYIDQIRNKVNMFLLQYKKDQASLKKIFQICNKSPQYEQFLSLNGIIYEFREDNTKICQFAQYSTLIDNQRINQEQKKIVEQLNKKKLNKSILKLLEFTQKSTIPTNIILLHFRQKLRSFQNQTVSDYEIIYKIKQKIINKNGDITKLLQGIPKKIIDMKGKSQQNINFKQMNYEQTLSYIQTLSSNFQNIIKPKIFSIQLFWRQINAFIKLNPNFKLNNQDLKNLIYELKSKEILCNQPFQLIDGDSLQMPKHIIERVFSGFSREKCLVVAIIGPQSSGKSTLLNFLFGCDFATSQGRCTRGLYGTYFRINDKKIINFEGIFVIDTQGLFPITNEVDEQHEERKNFDSKLVLFCIAVADFVIINVRGNLDKNTERILSICNEKLQLIGLQEDKKPEVIIILNQNNSSKTQESENEFKKIKKTFAFNLGRSLSLAFDIKNYTKNEIIVFQENQVLTKKIPLSQFHTETENLMKETIQKMKKRQSQPIFLKIDKFFQIWSTVLSFPTLSQMTSKECRKLEGEIKVWRNIQEDQINVVLQQITLCYKTDKLTEDQLKNKMKQLNQVYLQKFEKEYANIALRNSEFKQLLQRQRKQIVDILINNQKKLNYVIEKNRVDRDLSKEKFEGDWRLRELQKTIITKQNNGDVCTSQQKRDIFYKSFEQSLKRIQQTIKLKNIPQLQMNRIYESYIIQINNSESQIKECGLPKDQKAQMLNKIKYSKYEDFQKFIFEKMFIQNFRDHKLFMVYTNKPYTNVLKAVKYDAKLKYFDIREYFQRNEKQKIYEISLRDIIKSFDFVRFLEKYRQIKDQQFRKGQKNKIMVKLQRAFEIINSYLISYFAIEIKWFDHFTNLYLHEQDYFFIQILNNLTNERKLQLIKHSGKPKYHVENIRQQQRKNAEKFISLSIGDVYNEDSYKKNSFIYKPNGSIIKALKENLNWKAISQFVEIDKSQIMQSVNLNLINELNKDLYPLNLQIDLATNIVGIFQIYTNDQQKIKYRIFQNLKLIKKKNLIQNQESFQQSFSSMSYFQVKSIKESLKSYSKEFEKDNRQKTYDIGIYLYDSLEPNSKQFTGYQQSGRQIKKKFQQNSFENFIFKELKDRKYSIKKFFGQIFQIVKQTARKWEKFTTKAIAQVFFLINQQICQFNNDLNQISHQLHHIFVGKIHLSAIYLICKNQVDLLLKQENDLYQKKLEGKQAQLNRFLMRTSNDINIIVISEVQQMIQKFGEELQKKIVIYKQQLKKKAATEFKKDVNRAVIQQLLDIEMYTDNNTQLDIVLQYVQNPDIFINKKYLEKYQQKYDSLVRQFNKNCSYIIYFKEFSNTVDELSKALINDKITEERGAPNDLFESISRNSSKFDYDDQAKKILFECFVDKLNGEFQGINRKCEDIVLKPKFKMTKIQSLNGCLRQVFIKLKGKGLKMTNISKFVHFLKRQDIQVKIRQVIKKICSFHPGQQKQFINKIRVVICKQKCPCCGRICGLQDSHTFHQCIYGHQMRALGGSYIIKDGKKKAFVSRCQNISQTDLIEYNGNKYTWTKFKDYWAKKPVGGWLYDDLKNKIDSKHKESIENGWVKAGPTYCERNQIQYVDFNMASQQMNELIGKAHFIFALDVSGSMRSIWSKLAEQLEKILHNIHQFANLKIDIKISIIKFSTKAQILYERAEPRDINLSSIECPKGGTDFNGPFQLASDIINKNISTQRIIFVFMTDGYAPYPSQGVCRLKKIINRNNNQKNFKYVNIQYSNKQVGFQTTEKISKQFGGYNISPSNFDQLLKAYQKCIEIISFKEGKKQNDYQTEDL